MARRVFDPVFTGEGRDLNYHGWLALTGLGRAKFTDGSLVGFKPETGSDVMVIGRQDLAAGRKLQRCNYLSFGSSVANAFLWISTTIHSAMVPTSTPTTRLAARMRWPVPFTQSVKIWSTKRNKTEGTSSVGTSCYLRAHPRECPAVFTAPQLRVCFVLQ